MLYLYLFAIVYSLAEAFHDSAILKWYQDKTGESATGQARYLSNQWHRFDVLMLILLSSFIGFLLFGLDLPRIALAVVSFGSVRWIVFEEVYNLLMDNEFGYRGTVADIDVFLRNLTRCQFLALKGAFFLLCLAGWFADDLIAMLIPSGLFF